MTGVGDKYVDTNGSVFLKLVKFIMTDKFTGFTGITSRISHPLKTEGLNFLFELQDYNQSFRFYLFNFISANNCISLWPIENYFFISFRLFGSSSFDVFTETKMVLSLSNGWSCELANWIHVKHRIQIKVMNTPYDMVHYGPSISHLNCFTSHNCLQRLKR